MINKEEDIWVFPKEINFIETAGYAKKYRGLVNRNLFFFDLTQTTTMHTSFLGFLITVKHDLDKNGGRLILNTSNEISNLFAKMKITDFFTDSKSVEIYSKSA